MAILRSIAKPVNNKSFQLPIHSAKTKASYRNKPITNTYFYQQPLHTADADFWYKPFRNFLLHSSPGHLSHLQQERWHLWDYYGWTTIPVKSDKTPYPVYKKFFSRNPTKEQILERGHRWFRFHRDNGLIIDAKSFITGHGLLTGSASGCDDWKTAALDIDTMAAADYLRECRPDLFENYPNYPTRRGWRILFRTHGDQHGREFSDRCRSVHNKEWKIELFCQKGTQVVLPDSVIQLRDQDGYLLPEYVVLKWNYLPDFGQWQQTPLLSYHDDILPIYDPKPYVQVEAVLEPMAAPVADSNPLPPHSRETIFQRTLPTAHGQRNQRIFDLARGLKSLDMSKPVECHLGTFNEWLDEALDKDLIATKNRRVSEKDFEIAYCNVHTPLKRLGALPCPTALEAKMESLLERLLRIASRELNEKLAELTPLDRRILASHLAARRIFLSDGKLGYALSCRETAKRSGHQCSHEIANQINHILEEMGLIVLVFKGYPHPHNRVTNVNRWEINSELLAAINYEESVEDGVMQVEGSGWVTPSLTYFAFCVCGELIFDSEEEELEFSSGVGMLRGPPGGLDFAESWSNAG